MTTQRVTRDRLAIEHLLPQQWETHWPVGTDPTAKAQRSQSVHLIGNLTLLTGRLNTKISHGPWAGEPGKWAALEKHDVLLLNRHVRQLGATGWNNSASAIAPRPSSTPSCESGRSPKDTRATTTGRATSPRRQRLGVLADQPQQRHHTPRPASRLRRRIRRRRNRRRRPGPARIMTSTTRRGANPTATIPAR